MQSTSQIMMDLEVLSLTNGVKLSLLFGRRSEKVKDYQGNLRIKRSMDNLFSLSIVHIIKPGTEKTTLSCHQIHNPHHLYHLNFSDNIQGNRTLVKVQTQDYAQGLDLGLMEDLGLGRRVPIQAKQAK